MDDTQLLIKKLETLNWEPDISSNGLFVGSEPNKLFILENGLFFYKLKCGFKRYSNEKINQWATEFLEKILNRYDDIRINQIIRELEPKRLTVNRGPYR